MCKGSIFQLAILVLPLGMVASAALSKNPLACTRSDRSSSPEVVELHTGAIQGGPEESHK